MFTPGHTMNAFHADDVATLTDELTIEVYIFQ